MSAKLVFAVGTKEDIDPFIETIKSRMKWQDEVGIEHWNTVGYLDIFPRKYFEDAVQNNRLFVLKTESGAFVAGVTVWSENSWWKDDLSYEFYYLHNLCSDRAFPGSGAALLEFVEKKARTDGKKGIRVDVEQRNPPLNAFYQRLGYQTVDTVFDFDLWFEKREKLV